MVKEISTAHFFIKEILNPTTTLTVDTKFWILSCRTWSGIQKSTYGHEL